MHKRIAVLLALFLFVGFVTNAFGQEPLHRAAPAGISRAGAIAVIVESLPGGRERALWYQRHMPPMSLFYDVKQSEWYAPYLEVAFERGIIVGNPDHTFRPSAILTEEQAVVIGRRMYESKNPLVARYNGQGQDWISSSVNAAKFYKLDIPTVVRPGVVMGRVDFFAMIGSMGVDTSNIILATLPTDQQRPIQINPPQPIQPIIAARPAQVATTNRAVPTPVYRPTTTVTQQPTSTANASNKHFSISMPTLGVKDLTITHPTDTTTSQGLLAPLKNGVGHLFSYPGKKGKILVYGHSSSYPWDVSDYTKIFRQINKLAVGDKIYVTYNGSLYTYQVSYKQTVLASDTSAYRQTGSEELILYTCWPPDSIKERYLVHASPVEVVALNR